MLAVNTETLLALLKSSKMVTVATRMVVVYLRSKS